MKKQKNGLTLNEAKPNCFEKTKVRGAFLKYFPHKTIIEAQK
jgi:hypothetical protein